LNIPETIPFALDEFIHFVKEASDKLEQLLQEGWLKLILEEVLAFPNKLQEWQAFFNESQERIDRINQLSNELIEDEIDIPLDQNLTLLKEDLLPLKQRFAESKGNSWFFKTFTGRKYNYIFEKVRINSLPIRSVEDLNKILQFIDRADFIKKLILKWNRSLEEIRGPQLETSQHRLTATVMEYLQSFQNVLLWEQRVVLPMNPKIQALGIPGEEDWDNLEWFTKVKLGLVALQHKLKWKPIHLTKFKNIIPILMGTLLSESY
jgi:hypothetical protein